ncbi:hypothetical protein AB0P21_41090 [Kribbella sp. NPDC056861]|uniref:hypothetical protein n=1 Tax=Kribbella sp. NPDC056861 TaxID=3154857 RepID=UPI00343AD23E
MTDRVRPPELPPPAPEELAAVAVLARHAFQVAGQLRQLSERMSDLGWHTDEYSYADLSQIADSLSGMSGRAAMHSGDTHVLNEVTGKPWKLLGGDAH